MGSVWERKPNERQRESFVGTGGESYKTPAACRKQAREEKVGWEGSGGD